MRKLIGVSYMKFKKCFIYAVFLSMLSGCFIYSPIKKDYPLQGNVANLCLSNKQEPTHQKIYDQRDSLLSAPNQRSVLTREDFSYTDFSDIYRRTSASFDNSINITKEAKIGTKQLNPNNSVYQLMLGKVVSHF